MSAVEPDTELAAAIGFLARNEGLLTEMEHSPAGRAAATIVRAVLARPSAGRDLTAQDVRDALREHQNWIVTSHQHIADRLNEIARPAVARTDGQPRDGHPAPTTVTPGGRGIWEGDGWRVEQDEESGVHVHVEDDREPAGPEYAMFAPEVARAIGAAGRPIEQWHGFSDGYDGPHDPMPYAWGGGDGGRYFPTVEAPTVARTDGQTPADEPVYFGPDGRPALTLCPSCKSSQPHLHPTADLCTDPYHRPVPASLTEWRREVARWADLLDSWSLLDHSGDRRPIHRIVADMRREVGATRPAAPADDTARADALSRMLRGMARRQVRTRRISDEIAMVADRESEACQAVGREIAAEVRAAYPPEPQPRIGYRVLQGWADRIANARRAPADDTAAPSPVVGYVLARVDDGTVTLWDDDVRESLREIQIAHAEHIDEVGTPPWRCYELRDVCTDAGQPVRGSQTEATDG